MATTFLATADVDTFTNPSHSVRISNNVLAGGLGSDTLDGKDGTDTADYSRSHFFSFNGTFHTADQVGVNLATGTATEFVTGISAAVSIDTLISIENVIGTNGNDAIVGNDQANTLEGGDGNDVIDGGPGNDILDGGNGNDTLVGGDGNDTASYVSHFVGQTGTISLGLNGADGSATYGSVSKGGIFLFPSKPTRCGCWRT